MRINGEITSERPNEYDGKKGHVKQIIIGITDKSKEGLRLSHQIEYVMTEDEKAKYAGKSLDKTIALDVTKLETWQGAIRAQGRIVDVK